MRSLLELRMGLSRTRAGKEPPAIGGASMSALYGITGLSEDSRLTGGHTPQEVSGFSAFGRQATNPQWQHPFLYDAKANYSHILGRHSLKFGYEWQRIHTEIQDVNPLYGRDIYNGQFSRPAGGPADSASYNLADFMFGLRSEYQLVNFYIAQYRQQMNFFYVQDDWKVNSKLTLNLGVRYEYASPQGWQTTLINNMWSGEPLNLSYSPPAAFQVSQTLPDWRGGISYRPNLTGPVMSPAGQRTINAYLNTSAVVVPTDPSAPFGNAGRNVARSYALYQLDLGLSKSFSLPREGTSVQFRAEAFNLFNTTNFRNANTNRSRSGFGQVRATFPARQIQFALRIAF